MLDFDDQAVAKASRWWEEEGVVDHYFAGVFEGGGAKGVAYAGALQAMLLRRCWFKAVAGASAGAITAALVAAGLNPKQLGTSTVEGLANIPDPRGQGWRELLRNLKRLKKETGFLSKKELRAWLGRLLKNQVKELLFEGDANVQISDLSEIDFKTLYAATGIELHVVAANLSLNRQIVFNRRKTPDCQVADAVLASSSTPFVFESAELVIPALLSDGKTHYFYQTVVDGGVWSNFPMFVFEDAGFQKWLSSAENGEKLAEPTYDDVIGFLLDENREEEVSLTHREARFLPPRKRYSPGTELLVPFENDRAIPWEWVVGISREQQRSDDPSTAVEQTLGSKILARLGIALLWPLAFLARLTKRFSEERTAGRWPPVTKPRMAKQVADIIEGTLAGLNNWSFLITYLIAAGVLLSVLFGIRFVLDIEYGDLVSSGWKAIGPASAAFIGGLLYITLVLTAVLLVSMIWFYNYLSRALRRIGYGLIKTYYAGSGAPPWAGSKDNVISLPIVEGVTTLSFKLDEGLLTSQVSKAGLATLSQLDGKITERLKGRGVSQGLGWLADDKATQLIGIKKHDFLARAE